MQEIKYLKLNIIAIILLGILVFTMLYRQERIINRVSRVENLTRVFKIK